MTLLLSLLVAGATPEAVRLGEELASYGTLSALGPLVTSNETEELIKAHPELATDEQKRLRTVGKEVAATLRKRAIAAEGAAYAATLSVADLKALVKFARTAPARRQREALPKVIAGTLSGIGKVDYKGDVIAAYCAQAPAATKLCSH